MEINDKFIIDNCFRSTGAINTMYIENTLMIKYPELKTYLENRYNDIPAQLYTYKEVLLRIKNNVEIRPICPICGKPVKLKIKTKNNSGLFQTTCGNKECDLLNRRNKIKSTTNRHYQIFNNIQDGNISDYSSEEIEIYNKILKGRKNQQEYYNSYKFILKLINDNLDIKEIEILYPTEYKIYKSFCNKLQHISNKNKQIKSDYDKVLTLEYIDKNSDEYQNFLSMKNRKMSLSKTLKENYQKYQFIIEQLKIYSEDECAIKFTDEYLIYVSYKNKLANNSNRFSNYNFIIEKLKNITLKECEMLYPEAYKDYIKVIHINESINATYKKNNSYNSSKPEKLLGELLNILFPGVIRQYKDELYPFNCDFYIPEKRLYIEYQGSFFHNGKAFDERIHLDEVNKIKEKANKIRKDNKKNKYDILLETWINRDVNKREKAIQNKLNYLEIFPNFELTIDNLSFVLSKFSKLTKRHIIVGDKLEMYYDNLFINEINNGLQLNISDDEIKKEYEYFYSTNGILDISPNNNKIVLYFQEDNFYKREKELFSNDYIIRRQLIENRCKYLNKLPEELNNNDLVKGFRISRLFNSYSHFSPLWTKYFIQKFNIHSIIDPFGGWGHHLLGIIGTDCVYHYSDISENVVSKVSEMIKYFNLHATTNITSAENVNMNNVDAVFMCPPYFNIEEYECGQFSKSEYDNLMQDVFNNWKNGNVKIMGIIIREDFEYLFNDIKHLLVNKEIVNANKDNYNKRGKLNEFLYTFIKNEED